MQIIIRNAIHVLRIACIGIVFIGCKVETNEDLSAERPHKQIKMLMESIHDPVRNSAELEYNDKPSENSIITESVFSQKGVLIKKTTFNSKGNLEHKVTFKYDSNGCPVETDEYSFDGSLVSKEVNKYNSENKLIERNKIDGKGKIISKQTIQFGSDGGEVITTFALINAHFIKSKKSVLNAKGQTITNNYFTNGTLTSADSSRYDANGNRIEVIQRDLPKHERIITQYKYDGRRNITGMIVLDNSLMITSKVLSKYDSQNNLIESLTCGMLGNVTNHVRYSYEYDNAFNWTKKTIFVNGKPASVTVHRIEYY